VSVTARAGRIGDPAQAGGSRAQGPHDSPATSAAPTIDAIVSSASFTRADSIRTPPFRIRQISAAMSLQQITADFCCQPRKMKPV